MINKLFKFPQLTSANIVIFPACNELFILCLFGSEISFPFFPYAKDCWWTVYQRGYKSPCTHYRCELPQAKANACTCFTNRRKMCHCKILGQYMNAWPSLVSIWCEQSRSSERFSEEISFCKACGELRVGTVAYKPITTQVISLISGPSVIQGAYQGNQELNTFPLPAVAPWAGSVSHRATAGCSDKEYTFFSLINCSIFKHATFCRAASFFSAGYKKAFKPFFPCLFLIANTYWNVGACIKAMLTLRSHPAWKIYSYNG